MKIRVGNDEIDLLTKDDVEGMKVAIEGSTSALTKLINTPTVMKGTQSFTADANGYIGLNSANGAERIYHCQQGMEAVIERIVVTSSGYTPLSPLTGGQLIFILDRKLEFFLPTVGSTAIAPSIYETGNTGIRVQQNGVLGVFGSGFAAGLTLNIAYTAVQRQRSVMQN